MLRLIWLKNLGLCLGISCLFFSQACAVNRNPNYTKSPLFDQKIKAHQDKYYVAALEFDHWLKGQLSNKSDETLLKNCQNKPEHSPFCYSVTHFSELEERTKSASSQKRKTGPRTVVPKFKKNENTNWIELRFSSVGALLRGLGRVKNTEIDYLVKKALEETHCPNNIAISLAAFLEDELPKNISYTTLAQLYEKGGKCPPEVAGEAEVLLTRAGLFYFVANQLDKAEEAFKASAQDPQAFRSRALYWLSRIYEEKKQHASSRSAISELKQNYPFSFHTLMALHAHQEDLGKILKTDSPIPLTRSERMPHLNQLTQQVEILIQYGFSQSADHVFNWLINGAENAEPEFRLYLADLRETQGNHLSQLRILSSVLYAHPHFTSKNVMEKYFPKLFYPIFEKHSKGLDPYLLMSIARRESAFNPKAISRARAKGLMQISPHTQRQLSSVKNIFDPEANISVGSRYLSDLIRRMNGQLHLALASYNAGPNRVDTWVSRYPVSDPVLFVDLIPYRETREYVASVLRNYYWYRRLHTSSSPAETLSFELKN